ncbi:DUF6251 family protein [Streptomyces sp. NPDC020807]|uniref:DUF6251 family protein n=1 Tax=Streptomyces sp. NPDC020807 TaxID=3155119 RepID=UPI0034068B57
MSNLPEPIRVVQLPDGTYTYVDHLPAPLQSGGVPQVVHQHIHQAPPDRTIQRVALGAGVGAGAVVAGVYFGPLLIAALTSITANLAFLAFLALVLAWGVHTVVKSIGGPDGQQAAKTITGARRARIRKGK